MFVKNFDNQNKNNFTKINFQIKVPNVRVLRDGEALGIMSTEIARKMAQDDGLDLVEVAPKAIPPVCHIVEYSKYLYQQKIREKEQQKRQKETTIELKEVRFRPGIQNHDIEIKTNAIKRFIEDGKKVQVILEFKNREIAHKDEGYRVINKVIEQLSPFCVVEISPKMEGKKLICRFCPKSEKK